MSVYEFDMSAETLEKHRLDPKHPVKRYKYLPMKEADKATLVADYAMMEDDYQECTQWVVIEAAYPGADTEIHVWPLAADQTCPDDLPTVAYTDMDWDTVISRVQSDTLLTD